MFTGHRSDVVAVVPLLLLLIAVCGVRPISGHAGHDHDALVEPIFKQLEVVPDVLDVAPAHELIVSKWCAVVHTILDDMFTYIFFVLFYFTSYCLYSTVLIIWFDSFVLQIRFNNQIPKYSKNMNIISMYVNYYDLLL